MHARHGREIKPGVAEGTLYIVPVIRTRKPWHVGLPCGKQPQRVRASSLLCYFVVRELELTATAVGKELGLTRSAVSRTVQRGEILARDLELSIDNGIA